jgi:DNA repair protein SbcD/Mre11
MKILHFADLHIGMETYGSVDPASGLSSRMLDILKALDAVVACAIENNVDIVVFCGDAYKNRDPSQTQQRELAKRLRTLSEANIPIFLLVGNHDLPSAVNRATSVDIYDTLAINNIYIGNQFNTYRIPTKNGDIQIVALPWLRRSALLSRDDVKNLSIDDVNRRLEEIITTRLSLLTSELDPNVPSILAGHVTIASAIQGSEKTMMVGRDPVLLVSAVAHPNFDYIALGHIHKKQILNENPPMVYSGSLERLEFSDEKEDKGFYFIEIQMEGGIKKVDYEFHTVDARRFITIPIEIKIEDTDSTNTILKNIEMYKDRVQDAVVKVVITVPKQLESIYRDAEIYKALKEAYYVTISREIKDDSRVRETEWISESLTPIEALTKYLELKKIPDERRKMLLEYAVNLIKETQSAEG